MAKAFQTKYPIVFVHGMFGWGQNEGINKKAPYWGATTGSITDYLTELGVESYAASVGPMSSAWDQACELYAQLTGSRVDYGEAHSRLHGHKRYGRTYSAPLFEGWSSEKKIHLIGHSFGGNSSRMLAHLLANGSPEEVAASGEDTSPLFLGGKEELLCSLTAICSPLNGTLAYETAQNYRLITPLKFFSYNFACVFGRLKIGHKFADFHLEQFGVTKVPGEEESEPFKQAITDFYKTKDCISYDMYPSGSKELNSRIKILPSVYYFSYPFNAVDPKTNKAVHTNFPLMKATASLMLHDRKRQGKPPLANDGLVDVESARHPSTEPFTEYNPNGGLETGVWNVMPVTLGDHGTPIGLMADKEQTHAFYRKHLAILEQVESELLSPSVQ